jgi:acyl carrier protein
MLTKEMALQLMSECADSLLRSNVIQDPIDLTPGAFLYGDAANLDSIAFVSFITDVEERLNEKYGGDLVIALLDIDDFDDSAPVLTVDRFADYLVRLTAT